MDIRFINKRNEIINASELSIKRMRKFLVGMDEENHIVEIEEYESEERAEEVLKEIVEIICEGEIVGERVDKVIDLREEKR